MVNGITPLKNMLTRARNQVYQFMLKGGHFAPTLSLILNYINSKDKKALSDLQCK